MQKNKLPNINSNKGGNDVYLSGYKKYKKTFKHPTKKKPEEKKEAPPPEKKKAPAKKPAGKSVGAV